MSGYIAIPLNRSADKHKVLHFDTKEDLLKCFRLTEKRFDYLLESGRQAWGGYFFDEELGKKGDKNEK